MNKFDSGNIFEKNASYDFSLFNENTKIGKRIWPKIMLINIDNFNRFGTDLPILDFKIRDKTGEYEVDIFHSINIVLANWKKTTYNIDKEVTKYLEFITSREFNELKMIAEGDEDYMAAFRKVEDLSTDPTLSDIMIMNKPIKMILRWLNILDTNKVSRKVLNKTKKK